MVAEFDAHAGNRFFSAHCFNAAWDLIEKKPRTAAEDAQMLAAAAGSLWHWMQRSDATARNRSIGYWQVSRVLALLGYGPPARWFGQLCLEESRNEGPFYLGYAYECLARAAALSAETEESRGYKSEAERLAALVQDQASREQLLADLKTIAVTPVK